jgi:transposase-like protein
MLLETLKHEDQCDSPVNGPYYKDLIHYNDQEDMVEMTASTQNDDIVIKKEDLTVLIQQNKDADVGIAIKKDDKSPNRSPNHKEDKEGTGTKKKIWTKASRIKIVIEANNQGNNSAVARNHGLCEGTVRKWRSELQNEPLVKEAAHNARKASKKMSKGICFQYRKYIVMFKVGFLK